MTRELLGSVAYVVLFAFLLFVPGGSANSSRAWLLLVVLAAVRIIGSLAVFRVNPSLVRERHRLPWHADQPLADRVLLLVWMAGLSGLVALAANDGSGPRRLGAPPYLLLQVLLPMFVLGWLLVFHALRGNAFAVTVVRHQADRQHAVTDSGAYGIVRHPMYAGATLLVVGMCLWLQSWLAVLASGVPLGALLGRIAFEESML